MVDGAEPSGDARAPSLDPAARLRRAGKGEILDALRLKGTVRSSGGARSSVTLCRTRAGLWLVLQDAPVLLAVAGAAPDEGIVDLLTTDRRLVYRVQRLGDRLEIDAWRLGVPWGRGAHAQRMIAGVRVARAFGERDEAGPSWSLARGELDHPDGPWSWDGPFVDALRTRERAWLLRWLDADERLLVWLSTDEAQPFGDSPVLGGASSPRALVITERRQALVAVSPVGDLWTQSVDGQPLEWSPSVVGRGVLRARCGGEVVENRASLASEASFSAILKLPSWTGCERLRGLARALWFTGEESPASPAGRRAAAILATLADPERFDDPLAALTLALLVDPIPAPAPVSAGDEEGTGEGGAKEGEAGPSSDSAAELFAQAGGPSVLAALERLAPLGAEGGPSLTGWWRAWSVGPERGESVVEHLCELGPSGRALALPLHELILPVLQGRLEHGEDLVGAALLDFVLVEHYLALGEARRALELLGLRRERLPSEELQDLLPPSAERGGQTIRIELYELAAAAHRELGDGHVAALAELARLQPLVDARIDTLLTRGRERRRTLEGVEGEALDSLLMRAEWVRGILDEDGFALEQMPFSGASGTEAPELALSRGDERPLRAQALRPEELELLRHPAARENGVLGRLQGMLAKVTVPDHSQLKSYCERANLATASSLALALADASVLLGLGGVEPFVSRGDKSVGMRAYEGGTSYMLIGGDHLEVDSYAFLDEGALRFAVTCELAHLRFGHTRVTSGEVWSGTLGLGLSGLSVAIAAAPILKSFKAPAKHLLDRVGTPALKRLRQKLVNPDSHSLASDNSQLIAAHRVMQLTADRAGLVACGDPRAAIRGMFAVHPTHMSQWPLVVSHGLRSSLTRATRPDDERERLRLEDLAVRVAALLSFYLSDEYARLRRAGFA